MERSVLSFLKAEWKVSDTGWASSSVLSKSKDWKAKLFGSNKTKVTKQESQNQLCLREEYSRFSAKSMKNKMMCKHLSSTNFDIPMTKMEWILRNIIFRHTEYWRFQIQSIRSQTEMEKKLHLQEMEVLNAM